MHRAAIFGKNVESNEKIKKHDAVLITPPLLICYFIIEFVLFSKKLQFVLNTICKIAKDVHMRIKVSYLLKGAMQSTNKK